MKNEAIIMKKENREIWLNLMTNKLELHFKNAGYDLTEIRNSIKISTSVLPSKVNGRYYPSTNNNENIHEIFISREVACSIDVTGILIHELIHAYQFHIEGETNHGKNFRKIAIAVGLTGQMTATIPSAELIKSIKKMVKSIKYDYPQPDVKIQPKKQTTRNKKVECSNCGFGFRMSKSMISKINHNYCISCESENVMIIK